METKEAQMIRALTYGEKAVDLNFNPANDPKVKKVKELYAEIIDLMNERRIDLIENRSPEDKEGARLCSIAITEAQTAQMWAVKAFTWK